MSARRVTPVKAVLVRIGPVDDWVRTIAHHLRADPVLLSTERADLDPILDRYAAEPVVLSCDVPALNAVVQRLVRREQADAVALGWVADTDRASRELAGALGLPKRPTLAADIARDGTPRRIRMVRDDHGGVLLHRGTLTGAEGSLGAQTYHDDQLIVDGPVRWIEVRPDPAADCAVTARVAPAARLRRAAVSTGRSVQTACAEGLITVDGVARERPVTKWTWYADPRQHWVLRSLG